MVGGSKSKGGEYVPYVDHVSNIWMVVKTWYASGGGDKLVPDYFFTIRILFMLADSHIFIQDYVKYIE